MLGGQVLPGRGGFMCPVSLPFQLALLFFFLLPRKHGGSTIFVKQAVQGAG